jgi:membrane-bound lytic murein transglycosylase F
MSDHKGKMMARPILLVLISLFLLGGCTPTSENIARRDNVQPIQEEAKPPVEIRSVLQRGLDASAKRIIKRYGFTIRRYSERYGFDWRLILAVMKQESRFRHRAESRKGASGLMQIMPVTGEEVARSLDLQDVSHPENNIHGGIYYLRKLYDCFDGSGEADRLKLTLAAYNAGISRINDAQDMAAYLHEKPTKWSAVKDALPLLSRRFYTLQRNVWQQEKPRSGWFGNSRETIRYVAAVMNYYDEYRALLN